MDTRPTRHSPRYAHEAAVVICVLDGIHHGRTTNLSRGGLCADLAVDLPLGVEVEVDIELVFEDDAHSEPLRVSGRVVWCTRVDDSYQVGIAFCHVRADQAEFLTMFLRFLDRTKREDRSKRERARQRQSIDDRFLY